MLGFRPSRWVPRAGQGTPAALHCPAVLPAVSASASYFLTSWDLIGCQRCEASLLSASGSWTRPSSRRDRRSPDGRARSARKSTRASSASAGTTGRADPRACAPAPRATLDRPACARCRATPRRRCGRVRRSVAKTPVRDSASVFPTDRRRPSSPRPPGWPIAPGLTRARDEPRESARRNRLARWPKSMARDDHLGGPSAHSTTAETPWHRRESRGPGAGERSSWCHKSLAAGRPRAAARSVLTCTPMKQREHG